METQMHSEERNELLLVVDVMTTKLVALRPEQTCAHAVELLTQHSFRHFPVLNGDRTVAGVISDRDILWAMAEAAKWQTKPISSIMTRKIISASPETQAAPPREYRAGDERTRQAAEKDKASSEVGPKVQFTSGVVVPSENNKEGFCPNNCAEECQPGSDPEFVLANADLGLV